MYRIDESYLLLDKCHNINEYSECEKITGDNRADRTMQSVDEGNYMPVQVLIMITHIPNLLKIKKVNRDIEEDVLKWKNDTYVLWKHFSKKDWYIARCDLCRKTLKNAVRHNIKSHLNHCHKKEVADMREEITHSWLSQHFTFTDRRAICKYCNYRFVIFEEINVLKSHLDDYHDINKYSGCKEKIRDNNAGLIQQYVDERNYAGPSSYHDNTHPQSFENQEGQQRSNCSGQQGFKSYDTLLDFIDDLPDDIFMEYQQ